MKIRYKISSFTSENPNNPAINLASNTGDWQSSRFCTYPQQITIMFYDPVIINKIKIITHPNKVPQKINLLYHLPTVQNQNQYTKIGYIVFKQPKQDNQQVKSPQKKLSVLKQLKVIKNLELKALYLRLIIGPNHVCKSNFFNQVAISSIQIQGTVCQTISGNNLSRIQLKNDSLIQINNFTKDKIYLLTQFKQKCIQNEQYNEANQIKQIIKQINTLMQQVIQLNEEKIKYIHQQNYIKAKQIKQQISKIKLQIQHMSNNFYDPNTKIINKFNIQSSKIKNQNKSLNKQKKLNKNKSKQSILQNSFENQFLKDKQQHENQQDSPENHHQTLTQNDNQNNYIQNNSNIMTPYSYQERVVPALLNKLKKSDVKSENQELSQSKVQQILPEQPEELTPSNQANSSILSQFFQKITIRKLYSKYWQFKNQAIQQILADSKKHANSLIPKNKLKAYIFVYNRIMSKQNNKQFILAVIELINLVTGMKIQQKDFKIQMTRQLQKTIIQTLQKTQQNQNPKIKMQAEKVIIRMQQSFIFGNSLIYHAIIKNYDDKLSSKLKKIYLDTLQYMILNSQGTTKSQIPHLIVDFTVKKLGDPSNQVRKSSINLLKSLKKNGYEDRIKVCMSQQKGFKQSYLKQLGLQ